MLLRVAAKPGHHRPALGALLALVAMIAGLAGGPPGAHARAAKPTYPDVLSQEAHSRVLCDAAPDRIFVTHRRGTACISYIATSGHDDQRHAIVFFDGDVPIDRFADAGRAGVHLDRLRTALQALADRAKLRIIRVARLGLDGSSGNHGRRHRPDEVLAMHAAVDALKVRFGLDRVSLVGQSRGAMIAAALLTFGRKDVTCAALGSGVYEHARFIHRATLRSGGNVPLKDIARIVYDPSEHVDGIRRDRGRRIFVIGDPDDQRTPFDQQERFAKALAAAGHHVKLLPVLANDTLHHGATSYALNAVARCALGQTDRQIAAGAERIRQAVVRSQAEKEMARQDGGGTNAKTDAKRQPVTETGALPANALGGSGRQAP